MELCIVAIFKNEGHALHEWIEHYLKEGVDHFFLVDNGSTDGYDIQEYIKKGIAEVWINPKKHAQVELYNHYLKKAKQYKWVLVVDLDEFMYARNGYKSIKKYLRTVKPEVEQIKVPWKMFGSSGHIKQPKSIIQGFTKRRKYIHSKLNPLVMFVKTLVRGKCLLKIGIHTHITSKPKVILSNNTPSCIDVEPVLEEMLDTSNLHLNHYGIQSWDFFKRIKMTRGSASTKTNDKIRDKSYFKLRDTNELVDNELKNRTHRVRRNRFKTIRRRSIH
jgi:hypothetical protein